VRDLSEWQVWRVRDALRAHHRYERKLALARDSNLNPGDDPDPDHDPEHEQHLKYLTWRYVWEEIRNVAKENNIDLEMTAKNGAERLRVFVEGLNKKEGETPKYSAPKPPLMAAIIAFVTDENVGLLDEKELSEFSNFMPSWQAPVRLIEYLEQNFDTERIRPPKSLEGIYQTYKIDSDDLIIREMTIERSIEGGLLQVMETQDVYDEEVASIFHSLSPKELRDLRYKRDHYSGWAILTPEYNLLFFLKEERTGMNRYYFTLASNVTWKMDSPLTNMILFHHDFPFQPDNEMQTADEMIKALMEELPNNLFAFTRRRYEED
jgi:hypothetical protein